MEFEVLRQAIERASAAFHSKRYGETAGIAEDILAQIPEQPSALALLGAISHAKHDWERAADFLARSIASDQSDAARYAALATALRQLGRVDEALRITEEAMKLDSDSVEVLTSRAMILTDFDLWEESNLCLLKALGLNHHHVDSHFALAQNLLSHGEYGAGFREYEWRILSANPVYNWPRFTSAPWSGMKLPGKLLVIGDQGFGDIIQFSRYIPIAAGLCEELIVACDLSIVPLIKSVSGVNRITNDFREVGPHAAHVRLSSLPYLMQTRLDTIPPPILFDLDVEQASAWRNKLPGSLPRIGLAWRGRPTHPNDIRRSLNLSQLIPLGEVAKAHFVSLQKPFPDHDRPYQTAFHGLRDLELPDFAATAALIANLDLVITIDSSVAHLAGTLGVPTWVLLHKPNDWRWLLNRSDSPWYPSVRIFRQKTPGKWDEAISEVAQALKFYLR